MNAPFTEVVHAPRRHWVIRFFLDWAYLVVLLVAYEGLRDLEPRIGAPHHDLAWIDRALFGGQLPTIWLQSHFYRPQALQWQDIMATAIYFAYYIAPLVVGLLLWSKDRRQYHRFAASLLTLCALAFLTYAIMPTVPPWLSDPQAIHKITDETIRKLNLPGLVVAIYLHHDYNEYAAFPSLHSAFPVVLLYYGRRCGRLLGAALVGYAVLVWLSVVYLGEHYVADILGGVTYAVVAIAVVEGAVRWRRRRAVVQSQPALPLSAPARLPPDR
jgi:membrane-associated phospholipid phosphatase